MIPHEKSSDEEKVICEVCLKEIPVSEAKSPEAVDYFIHFCGLECYEKWKSKEKRDEQRP